MTTTEGLTRSYDTEAERIERLRTRVLKSEPLDVFEVVGFISGVIGICVMVGLLAGWLL